MLVGAIAVVLCLTAASVTESAGPPTPKCLQCMCEAYGCDGTGWSGYLHITWPYWSDAGKPGASYYACVHDLVCSKQAVVAYMERYVTKPQDQNCERYARVHFGGPWGWQWNTDNYWSKVELCCNDGSIMPGQSCD